MSQLAAAIARLRTAGLQLRVVSGKLRVDPPGQITPEMDRWLRDHAKEVKGYLEAEQTPGLPVPNTTPTPDVFFDELAPTLNERELRAMLYIIRRTYGFKKHQDSISITQFIKGITTQDGRQLDRGTGMNRSSVIRALRSLEARGLVEAVQVTSMEHGNEATRYRLVLKP